MAFIWNKNTYVDENIKPIMEGGIRIQTSCIQKKILNRLGTVISEFKQVAFKREINPYMLNKCIHVQ